MARLRNVSTGVEVSIDDSKVGNFSPTIWEPADGGTSRPAKKTAAKKTAAKKTPAKKVASTEPTAAEQAPVDSDDNA